MALEAQLKKMKAMIAAAEDEIVMAAMFHETWRPAAYDKDLHKRMGHSFATHSFQIVRLSLRRELLMALMRLWDTNREAIPMTQIAQKLSNRDFFDALVNDRADGLGLSSPSLKQTLRDSLDETRKEVLDLVHKYSKGGPSYPVFKRLQVLRHTRLAHRQREQENITQVDTDGQDVQSFYDDNLQLVKLLLSLVLARAFDLTQAAGVYSHHAKYFWAGVRGTHGRSPKLLCACQIHRR